MGYPTRNRHALAAVRIHAFDGQVNKDALRRYTGTNPSVTARYYAVYQLQEGMLIGHKWPETLRQLQKSQITSWTQVASAHGLRTNNDTV